MRKYRHTFGLTNGQTWGCLIEAENWHQARQYGNAHAREAAREENTHVSWQSTRYIRRGTKPVF